MKDWCGRGAYLFDEPGWLMRTHDQRKVLLFYKEPLAQEIPGLTSTENTPTKGDLSMESPAKGTPGKTKHSKTSSGMNTSTGSIVTRDLLDPVEMVESSQFALLLPSTVERGDFEQQINSVQMDLDEPYLTQTILTLHETEHLILLERVSDK